MDNIDIKEEGQRAVESHADNASATEEGQHRIDVRKLIIYSEILKPRFDEGLN